ncbi:phosphate signaling complex protein PhoU [Staphylococcus sp. SQ8-PEA]|uniref:Phosphate-specific transport system accessory protein PhoU n=1 Tax=Staphylococcus marylandisciuri TaxID=2981529 RepID=A0ABT2QNL6_9STAP|nr:phosphate signaling complex protein PhoU [Staphylococcus marylandisciuri]MCU5745556.1 phosphate signaling complex protein PhoU [Staphylococcus marylandisciuri]
MNSIRYRYDKDINNLIGKLRRMGKRVYMNIYFSVQSLSDKDRRHARYTITKDKEINCFENQINNDIIMLITKQQPVASDLRLIMASLKIANDLERIGDNAANIASIRLRTPIKDHYVLKRLETMGQLSLLMLEDLNDAIKEEELALMSEIIERDSDIDDLYKNIINTTYLIDNDPFVAGQAHLAARHLERIGDHIGNIAKNIIYFYTGDHHESYKNNLD